MRHGQAEQASDDFERPLSEAGLEQARTAGAALGRRGWVPELLLTSSAPRAQTTAECVAAACGYRGSIRAERVLYLAPEGLCLKLLQALPDDVGSVLLVGHNPGLSALVRLLFRQPRELATADYASAELALDTWSELG